MAILLNNHGYGNTDWQQEISRQLPDMPIYIYPELEHSVESDINYALVWNHPKGDLRKYENLHAVFSLGAGMEHLLDDDNLPDVPLVPLLDPTAAEDMANYSLYWVINRHRHFDDYHQQQTNKIWQPCMIKPSHEFKVTVLGLGRIAQKVAETIRYAGYQVNAWDFKTKTFTDNQMQDITMHFGLNQLHSSMQNADIVINCLPNNDSTKGLINSDLLAECNQDTTLISISRGAIINEQDLFAALNNNTLHSAVLDVFCVEPLPQQHEFWNHPKVTITPHISGTTYARSAVKVIVNNIQRMEKGEAPVGVYDKNRANR